MPTTCQVKINQSPSEWQPERMNVPNTMEHNLHADTDLFAGGPDLKTGPGRLFMQTIQDLVQIKNF